MEHTKSKFNKYYEENKESVDRDLIEMNYNDFRYKYNIGSIIYYKYFRGRKKLEFWNGYVKMMWNWKESKTQKIFREKCEELAKHFWKTPSYIQKLTQKWFWLSEIEEWELKKWEIIPFLKWQCQRDQ